MSSGIPGGEARKTGIGSQDPVLADLGEVAVLYRDLRDRLERAEADVAAAIAKASAADAEKQRAQQLLAEQEAELASLRTWTSRQEDRADRFESVCRDIHRSIHTAGIYDLILRACITLTGATRGIYVTARGSSGLLKVRSAVDIDGYPQAPLSPHLTALCRLALKNKETLVCNEEGGVQGVPPADRAAERFENCLVAPVILLKNLDGVVLVADKVSGDFNPDDISTLVSVGSQAAVAIENLKLQDELRSAYLATVSMLADAVEAKDSLTRGHCEEVSRYARLTAHSLGLSEHDRALVCYAALLHDVGKIGVSDGVLHKPGPLLPEERELVKAHVRIGHDLIAGVPALKGVAKIVLHHHEWWDGTGYPDGLKGEEIPVPARVVGVVDAYCAMTSRRAYKDAYTTDHARDELRRCSGTQFDPKVVDQLLGILDSPDSRDRDEDEDAECGVLPIFADVERLRESVRESLR